MFVSEKQLEESEKKINDKIENLKQKVNANQGEIILTSRDIILKENTHCMGSYFDSMNYIETGIIQGELKLLDWHVNSKRVGSIGLMDSSHLIGDYCYTPQVQIPVKRKLSKNGVNFSLDFLVQELENLKENRIVGIERLELDPGIKRGFESTPGMNLPYLNSLEILIGEEEIQNFAKEKVRKKSISSFFNLIKNPDEIENRINKHYYNERQKLANELVQNVAQLCICNNKIKKLEEDVLEANFTHYSRDEGEWDSCYRDNVYEYKNLRKTAGELFEEIEKNFNDADKIQLIKYPEIDMRTLGIPQIVKTADFLDYLRKSVLLDYSKRVKKIDEHIRKELAD